MTLRDLMATHPDAFYAQTWYLAEPFMDREAVDIPTTMPKLATTRYPEAGAVELARLYLQQPDHPLWRFYLWTTDTDTQGQRVYVGHNGHGLEIHRHLKLTDRWKAPVW